MDLYHGDIASGETALEGNDNNSGNTISGAVVGDRFHPNDEELVDYYLKRFILALGYEGNDSPIAELNVYKFEPCELPGYSKINSNDQEWYFISPLEFMDKKKTRFNRKTKTGTWKPTEFMDKKKTRFNRKTKTGAWKPTGKPRKVLRRGSKKVIGSKRTLVFHEKNVKTEWVMHEYQYIPDSDLSNAGEFVIIKLRRKPDDKIKKSKLKSNSCINCDNETVDSTCNSSAIVSAHCKSQNNSETSVDSASSCDIQSSVTELEECRENAPLTPFLFQDQLLVNNDTSESFVLEDQSTIPNSLFVTYDVQLSVGDLRENDNLEGKNEANFAISECACKQKNLQHCQRY